MIRMIVVIMVIVLVMVIMMIIMMMGVLCAYLVSITGNVLHFLCSHLLYYFTTEIYCVSLVMIMLFTS